MTHTEELIRLAEDAIAYCNKCGYVGKEEPLHKRPKTVDECCYQAVRMVFVRPDDIKQLIGLIRLQNEALKLLDYGTRFEAATEAIAAFNKFEQGEE